MKELQTASHTSLQLIGLISGNPEKEKELHCEFIQRGDHIMNEWFHASRGLLKFIELASLKISRPIANELSETG